MNIPLEPRSVGVTLKAEGRSWQPDDKMDYCSWLFYHKLISPDPRNDLHDVDCKIRMVDDGDGGKKKVITVSKSQPCTFDNFNCVLNQMGIALRYNIMTSGIDVEYNERIRDYRKFLWEDKNPRAWIFIPSDPPTVQSYWLLQIKQMCELYGMRPREKELKEHAHSLAKSSMYHPFEDYLANLPEWDGHDYFADLNNTVVLHPDYRELDGLATLKEEYIRVLLFQLIGASRNHRAKKAYGFRSVVILAGQNRVGKSRWLCNLLPEQFEAGSKQFDLRYKEADTLRDCYSHFLVECGEFDGILRRNDNAILKEFITKTHDKYRPAWYPVNIEINRSFIITGTSNYIQVMQDPTGNSRMCVIPVEKCFVEDMPDHDKLWAQMVHQYEEIVAGKGDEEYAEKSNIPFLLSNRVEEMAKEFEETFMSRDPNVELAVEHFMQHMGLTHTSHFTPKELRDYCNDQENRINYNAGFVERFKVMAQFSNIEYKVKRVEGKPVRGYHWEGRS